jgi:hypothetical protein
MKVTPRYVVQLSSAEVAFLHALVQRQVRGFVAERPEGRGMDLAAPPPELVSLDRRLLARLQEVADDEEVLFGGRQERLEAIWINEEHAALAEVAANGGGVRIAAPEAPVADPIWQGSNVTPLHGTGRRPRARAG